MMSIKTEVDAVAVVSWLDELPGKIRKSLVRAMDRLGYSLEKFVKTEKLSGQVLDVRTGNLRRAIFHRVGETADDVFVVVGADLEKAKYARIQELGGVIRPKRSANLTIPLTYASTKAGVARFSARDLIQSPGSYGYVGTFTRNKIIFGKLANGQIRPLFVLKPQVTIKAVGYLSGTMTEKRREILDTVSEALKDATGSK